jgi:hypothetical protein
VRRYVAVGVRCMPPVCQVKYKSDGIPHIRYGRRVLFDRTETDRWLTSKKVNPEEAEDAQQPTA